jgi:hypothetical protein
MKPDMLDQLRRMNYYVNGVMSTLPDDAANEIERLRASLKEERELRLSAETRAMARIAEIDIRDAHIRYLKSAINNKEGQQ